MSAALMRRIQVLNHFCLLVLACSLMGCNGSGGDADSGSGNGSGASTAPFMPTPDADEFYAQPKTMPKVPAGTILNSRKVQFAPLSIPLPNDAWQLQYMSADMRGRPQMAIATVVKPLLPSVTGNKPLVSMQFAENSPGLKCAPSHQVTGGLDNSNSQLEALDYIPQLLALGWTLVFPDHLGPTSSVAVGRIAAPIVLDGIRAAESFEALGLDGVNTPVGLMGYSGGGLATTWSAGLQPHYAPELNIVGVAVGGLPANLEATAKAFDGDPLFFPVMFGAIVSINRVFPQLIPPGLLNEKGEKLAESVKDGCLGNTTDGSAGPSGQLSDYTTVDPYSTPGAKDVLPKLTLPQPDVVATAETYFYHQTLDQLAPVAEMEKVAAAWCAAGTRVHVYKDFTGEHVAGAVTAVPSQYLFLLSRFAGTPTPVLLPGTVTCN